MKKTDNKTVRFEFPFFQILTLIFITLKVLGKINWKWRWVLGPLWIPIVTVVFLATLIVIIEGVTKDD